MWEIIASVLKEYRVGVKVKLPDYESTEWSPWFTLPTEGYGEVKDYGPFRLEDLRSLIINPIETKWIGQRVPGKQFDHTEKILKELGQQGIKYLSSDAGIVVENDENMNGVESLCGGDIQLWSEQEAIHVKMSNPDGDPLELSVDEARELARVLLSLAEQLDD